MAKAKPMDNPTGIEIMACMDIPQNPAIDSTRELIGRMEHASRALRELTGLDLQVDVRGKMTYIFLRTRPDGTRNTD